MWKIIIKYKILRILGLALVVAMEACTSNFEELNTPPTSVTTVDPGLLLTQVQKQISFSQAGERMNNVQGSWIQHWAGGPILGQSRYIPQPFSFGNYDELRSLALIRNELLVGLEDEPSGRTKLAMAKIMEIFAWQDLTDMFGPIPYSESSLPSNEFVLQPAYDSQQTIYASLINELDTAMERMNPSDESYGDADLLYGGDIEKWRKLANALKLRLGMRIKYADPALSQATVESALAGPIFTSSADDAKVGTNNAITDNQNPNLRQFFAGSPDLFYLGETLIEALKNTEDPRLPLIAAPNQAGTLPEYQGIRVAETDVYYSGIIRNQFSTASSIFDESLELPAYIISYADVCFFKAEAALEGWAGYSEVDAEGFYQDAIRAAMAMEPFYLADTDIPTTFMDNVYPLTGTKEQKLEQIMTQKWIMLFGRNLEAWTEWRRTGYPILNPGPYVGGEGIIPRRMIYPTNEALVNSTNYAAAVATLAEGDSYGSKVWWDKK